MRRSLASLPLLMMLAFVGCSAPAGDSAEYDEPFTSAVATLLNFDFDGQLTAASASNPKGLVRAQLLYTVGHFNGENGVAQLQKLVLTNITSTYLGGGLYRVKYHAHLPVAWGGKTNLPTSYALTLPMRADAPTSVQDQVRRDLQRRRIGRRHRRQLLVLLPSARGRLLARRRRRREHDRGRDGVERRTASRSTPSTTRSGRTTASRSSPSSASTRSARNDDSRRRHRRVQRVRRGGARRVPVGDDVPREPAGRSRRRRSGRRRHVRATRADGKTISDHRAPRRLGAAAGAAFDTRYDELSTDADLIMYNGHAGLGANVRALVAQGQLVPRQVPDPLHERLRHVRLRRRHAPEAARAAQPRRPDGHEVHGHRHQRDAGVLRVDGRRVDGAHPRAVDAEHAADLRADLPQHRLGAGRGGDRRRGQRVHAGLRPGRDVERVQQPRRRRLQADESRGRPRRCSRAPTCSPARPSSRTRRATPTCACASARRRPSRRPTSASRTSPTRTSAAS